MGKSERKGDEECNNLCGPRNKLICYLFVLATNQARYGASAFPGGQKQLNGILMKFAKLAHDPNHCRSENAGTEIEGLKK